jgi:Asp-tRNA(Asn)/Glu-tRNA(Gln) amidotransferase A subunit family amidase
VNTNSDELAWLPGWKLRAMMERKELSPVELMRYLLDRVARLGAELGAFITVFPEDAMAHAKSAEQVIMRGDPLPLLHGLPVSVKDYVWTKGQRTTMGSRLYAEFAPEQDSVPSERLKAAGAAIFAKTNMPEFSNNIRTLNLLTREAVNPWDRRRSSGGSSGGSGVAVAAGLGPLSIGTDDGGSIRIPSAFNGIFGLLPSQGRVPNGAGPFAAPHCGIGPMTRDVRDAAMLLQAIAGSDARDRFAMKSAVPDYLADLEKGVTGLRIGWSRDWGRVRFERPEIVELCHEAAMLFGEMGAIYEEPDFRLEDPLDFLELETDYAPAQYMAYFRKIDPDFQEKFTWIRQLPPEKYLQLTPYVRNHVERATPIDYINAILPEVRYKPRTRIPDIFARYDLLISPTIGRTAFFCGDATITPWQYIAYTYIVNVSGCCAASIPIGFFEGMPIGMQIVGRPDEDALVLRAARAFERIRPWAQHRPPCAIT